ncbi:MAG: FtsX-like permease family protein, partial [Oscillibacter sp.]|nr:FtsX-like permease family protein [Oscillibacter sp.]
KYNQVCTVGADAAKLFFGSANPVGKNLMVNGTAYRVVGVYASRLTDSASSGYNSNLDNIIVFPYTAQRMLGGEKPSEFVVKLRDSDKIKEVKARVNGFLKGVVPNENFYVYSNDQWQQYEEQALGMIGGVLAGIAAISLLVGGIGIMNIMLVTVTERTREIGIRRAIGAQRASIVAQFLIEAAMLCGFGGLVGIAVGTGGSLILGRLMFQMTIYPSLPVTLGAFSLSVAIGVLFGSYPAAKASRLQPVEALRAE